MQHEAGQNYKYAGSNDIKSVGWYKYLGRKTHPVGGKNRNGYELYDMSGNVYEWCNDWYRNGYSSSSQTNPQGPKSGYDHVLRGGSWRNEAQSCRVSNRSHKAGFHDFIGFRLAHS